MSDRRTDVVRAAGAVVWRTTSKTPSNAQPDLESTVDSNVEVAVVHRPRYDDWSLPKGKLETEETVVAAAVREIAEETGLPCVLGRRLGTVRYSVRVPHRQVPKRVDYFAARTAGGEFVANDEVDQLRWLDVSSARKILRYQGDLDILDEFNARRDPRLRTLLLVRHAKAGSRDDWAGDDDLRPLSRAGKAQADALRSMLPHFGADRAHAAPRLRCAQTVAGLADDLGVSITAEPLLSEEGYWRDEGAGVDRLRDIVAAGGTPVVSSQGGVIPNVLARLANPALRESLGAIRSKKGSLWVLSFESTSDGPALAYADYYPTALPPP